MKPGEAGGVHLITLISGYAFHIYAKYILHVYSEVIPVRGMLQRRLASNI